MGKRPLGLEPLCAWPSLDCTWWKLREHVACEKHKCGKARGSSPREHGSGFTIPAAAATAHQGCEVPWLGAVAMFS